MQIGKCVICPLCLRKYQNIIYSLCIKNDFSLIKFCIIYHKNWNAINTLCRCNELSSYVTDKNTRLNHSDVILNFIQHLISLFTFGHFVCIWNFQPDVDVSLLSALSGTLFNTRVVYIIIYRTFFVFFVCLNACT